MTTDTLIPLDQDSPQLKGWMPVLIPQEDFLAVAQFVAARQAERSARPPGQGFSGHGGSEPDARLAAHPAWPEEALRRLASSSSVTAQRWTAAMDAIAKGDQDWYTTSEVASASGLTINEWRDAPRKISRHLQAHYTDVPMSGENLAWPLCAWTNPENPGEVSWGMAPVTKERWIAIRDLG